MYDAVREWLAVALVIVSDTPLEAQYEGETLGDLHGTAHRGEPAD
jgi:hypothetical protein